MEVGDTQVTRYVLIQEMTNKIYKIKHKLKATRDRQKSHVDVRRKPLSFKVGDKVFLKVSSWKDVIRFGKTRKLAPRYIGPYEIISKIGPVAYRLKLPSELSTIHDVFHVSNLKRCLTNETIIVPLEDGLGVSCMTCKSRQIGEMRGPMEPLYWRPQLVGSTPLTYRLI